MDSYRNEYQSYHNVILLSDEDIHHIDWDRANNEMSNLIAIPRVLHILIHKPQGIGYVNRQEINHLLGIMNQNKAEVQMWINRLWEERKDNPRKGNQRLDFKKMIALQNQNNQLKLF